MSMSGLTIPTELPAASILKEAIEKLQEKLAENSPEYEGLLYKIHNYLKINPDTVHLLSNEEIGQIVIALSKKTGTVIAEAEVKKTRSKSNLSKLTLGDI